MAADNWLGEGKQWAYKERSWLGAGRVGTEFGAGKGWGFHWEIVQGGTCGGWQGGARPPACHCPWLWSPGRGTGLQGSLGGTPGGSRGESASSQASRARMAPQWLLTFLAGTNRCRCGNLHLACPLPECQGGRLVRSECQGGWGGRVVQDLPCQYLPWTYLTIAILLRFRILDISIPSSS